MTAAIEDPLAGRPRSGPPKEWSIAIYRGRLLGDLQPVAGAVPALTAAMVDDAAASFVADPFLFVDRGTWHLFFEFRNIATRKGELAVATSDDGISWRYEGAVLAEPFHLSYPHVFRAGDEIFMTPESIEARGVRLYRAVDFPRRWVFERTIVDGVYADPTVFRHDGRWWLLGCPRPMRHDALSLFWADDVRGPWHEHPASPIVRDDRSRARPAGRVQLIGSRLHRFAQDCDPAYGSGVRAFAITSLTTTLYAEEEVAPVPLLFASGRGWNRDGMHHIDLQPVGDEWLACVDGYTTVPESAAAIEVITDTDSIAAEWDLLLEGTRAHSVFSSYAWFRAALLADPEAKPHVLIARRYDRITGILPLVERGKRYSFATPMSDVNDVIAFDGETARQLLLAAPRPLDLRCLPASSFLLSALPDAVVDTECFVADLDDAYFASRSRNFRKTLFRAERRASEAGLKVVELDAFDPELFLALNAARFGERSRFAAPAAARFIREAFPPLFASRRLRAWALVRDEKIVAIDLVVDDGTAFGIWNGGFLPEVESFSPGRLLFAAEFRAAIVEKRPRLDLLRGTHPYKASWATRVERLYRATLA